MSHVRRFDHVGITVADLDTVTAFFVGLGLEVEGRTFVEGEFLDTVSGIPDSRTEIVMLRPPDGGTRPAPGAHGGRLGQRQYRDRMAGASSRASARSPAGFQCERAGGRRADEDAGRDRGRDGIARFRAVRYRACQKCARRRVRLRHDGRAC